MARNVRWLFFHRFFSFHSVVKGRHLSHWQIEVCLNTVEGETRINIRLSISITVRTPPVSFIDTFQSNESRERGNLSLVIKNRDGKNESALDQVWERAIFVSKLDLSNGWRRARNGNGNFAPNEIYIANIGFR